MQENEYKLDRTVLQSLTVEEADDHVTYHGSHEVGKGLEMKIKKDAGLQ